MISAELNHRNASQRNSEAMSAAKDLQLVDYGHLLSLFPTRARASDRHTTTILCFSGSAYRETLRTHFIIYEVELALCARIRCICISAAPVMVVVDGGVEKRGKDPVPRSDPTWLQLEEAIRDCGVQLFVIY